MLPHQRIAWLRTFCCVCVCVCVCVRACVRVRGAWCVAGSYNDAVVQAETENDPAHDITPIEYLLNNSINSDRATWRCGNATTCDPPSCVRACVRACVLLMCCMCVVVVAAVAEVVVVVVAAAAVVIPVNFNLATITPTTATATTSNHTTNSHPK
jgi:hypothetical protein